MCVRGARLGKEWMKSKVLIEITVFIAIVVLSSANSLAAYSYPEGWSDDFRITDGAEEGGVGKFIHFFDISQSGDYYFVVQDSGRSYTFLTRTNAHGVFVVEEKELLRENPLYTFLDSSGELHVFYSQEDEIKYVRFDADGAKIINSLSISDQDRWRSFKPLATTDDDGNLAIFWLDQNSSSSEGLRHLEVMYEKTDNEGTTLIPTKTLSTIYADPWGEGVQTCFDQDRNFYVFWKEEETDHIYNYYFITFDINGNILQNKTFIDSLQVVSGDIWNYDRFLVSNDKIHLFISHTEKKTTPKGQFIEMRSYINHTQFHFNGTKISEKVIFTEINGTIFGSLFVALDADEVFHLVWNDEIDYGVSTGASAGYSHDSPTEIYYLTSNGDGELLGSATRLTDVDQRNSQSPYLRVKITDLFLVWSDNRNYKGDDNQNGFDIFLKSTSPINIEPLGSYAGEEFPLWVISTIAVIAIVGVGLGVGFFFWRRSKTTTRAHVVVL